MQYIYLSISILRNLIKEVYMIPKYYIYSTDVSDISIALLIKEAAFSRDAIKTNYLQDKELIPKIVAIPLEYDPGNKVKAKTMEAYLQTILPELNNIGIKTIYCADSNYFKHLTKQTVSTNLGSIAPCKIKGYEHMEVIPGVNYQAIFHNPNNKGLLELSLDTLVQHVSGYDVSVPKDIIKSGRYIYVDDPKDTISYLELSSQLNDLLSYSKLAIDIETQGLDTTIEKSGLRFNTNKIVSIAISKSESEGIAVYFNDDPKIKLLLKQWFERRSQLAKGDSSISTIYHNGLFDIKNLIYHLFMNHPGDIPGMFLGIDHLAYNIDDTLVMTYLCTNNAQENVLGLKENTLHYTGQYAVDVTDISKLTKEELLEYNMKDTLATFWLYNKRKTEIVTENQEKIYKEIFLPAFPVLLEMMLMGLPLNTTKVKEVKKLLTEELTKTTTTIYTSQIIKDFNKLLQQKATDAKNATLKTKQVTVEAFKDLVFNPGSSTQKIDLLYEVLKLPILDYTKTKLPATGNKTITKLIAWAIENGMEAGLINLLKSLKDYTDITKILTTFIKAFEDYAFDRGDGTTWLNGDHILCGTVSGRLGSRAPNLANLPSNSRFGEAVKSCFQSCDGWLFVGADYSSLEDRVVAILSDDPMKKKPFTDGIDAHCLNAYGYFKDQMQQITEDNINDIKELYPNLRQDSKAPTFA